MVERRVLCTTSCEVEDLSLCLDSSVVTGWTSSDRYCGADPLSAVVRSQTATQYMYDMLSLVIDTNPPCHRAAQLNDKKQVHMRVDRTLWIW